MPTVADNNEICRPLKANINVRVERCGIGENGAARRALSRYHRHPGNQTYASVEALRDRKRTAVSMGLLPSWFPQAGLPVSEEQGPSILNQDPSYCRRKRCGSANTVGTVSYIYKRYDHV